MIRRHSHLKIARYHQHLAEKLDMDLSPLEYMMKEYPDVKEIEDMRKIVGRYGITGKNQVVPISNLSDGLRVSSIFFFFVGIIFSHFESINNFSKNILCSNLH